MRTLIIFAAIGIAFTGCGKADCKGSEKPNCICTQQYDPVCGCDGITYGNSCEAECEGVKSWSPGACPQ